VLVTDGDTVQVFDGVGGFERETDTEPEREGDTELVFEVLAEPEVEAVIEFEVDGVHELVFDVEKGAVAVTELVA